MQDALIVGIVFFSLVSVVKIIADHRTRSRLIEKGAVDDRTRWLLAGHSDLVILNNLKWGMVLVGIGLASLLSYWLDDYFYKEGALGLIFVFAGLGFLVYYPLAQRRLRDIERREAERGNNPIG